MLVGATVVGVLLALMMANGGGAWDNAKKYIEAGHFGGKGLKLIKQRLLATRWAIHSKIHPAQHLIF